MSFAVLVDIFVQQLLLNTDDSDTTAAAVVAPAAPTTISMPTMIATWTTITMPTTSTQQHNKRSNSKDNTPDTPRNDDDNTNTPVAFPVRICPMVCIYDDSLLDRSLVRSYHIVSSTECSPPDFAVRTKYVIHIIRTRFMINIK